MERISKCSAPHEAKIIQSFVPNSFSSERNRLTRAHFQTFCSPNVACFCFASIFFVSVEPIITIRGLIIVMLSCTLSADFVFTRSSSQTIITPCVDAIFSAGVCHAALRSGRWSLRADLSFFLASVCKGAKADVVFLIDGSWSIGEESFTKVVHFVSGMIGAFDIVGPSGMQVCI